MEYKEIAEKALCIKKLAEQLRDAESGEPYLKANAESVYAHARLICNELGLDLEKQAL